MGRVNGLQKNTATRNEPGGGDDRRMTTSLWLPVQRRCFGGPDG